MNARFRESDGTCVMDLNGDLDVYSSPLVKRDLLALFKRGRTRVVVNLEKVTYIDSTGLGMLIDALRRARDLGGSISIVVTANRTRRIFEMLGLQRVFGLFDEVESAVAASSLARAE